jgi:hypothetical protein
MRFVSMLLFVEGLPPIVTKNQMRIGVRQPREEGLSVVHPNHVTKGLADAERFILRL